MPPTGLTGRTIEEDRLITSRARALGRCTFIPGSWDKCFASDMAAKAVSAQIEGGGGFTGAEVAWITHLCWKYRRQVGKLAPDKDPGRPSSQP